MSPRRPLAPGRFGGSVRRQLVLLSAAVTAVAAILLVVLVQLVLDRTTTSAVGQVLEDRAEGVVVAIRGASGDGSVVVPGNSLEAGVAVYDDAGRLVAGAAPSSLTDLYERLSTSTSPRVTGEIDERVRARAQPFSLTGPSDPDGQPRGPVAGVVVVTERLVPYEKAERDALVVGVVTGLLAVLASAGLAAWVSRRALRPVVEMAATAGEWSERDLGRRFDLDGPANEITALAGVLDGLLDKVSTAIRAEQRLTGELAHELRTPLTAVQGTADLVLMRPGLDDDLRADLEEIRAGTRRMAETITGLLELARSASSLADAAASPLRAALDQVVAAHPGVVVDPGATGAAADVQVGLPAALVVRALSPVVDNAVRVAAHVTVSLVPARPGHVAVAVDDDGPGVDPAERERIFEAGHTVGDHGGSGLGLPLARRIARSAGGDVRHEPREVGSRFVVELPRA